MMDFITIPLVCGIIFSTTYGLFELFVRRKERLLIIEKLADKLNNSADISQLKLMSYKGFNISASALRIGCLLIGLGIGLLVGLFLNLGLNLRNYGSDYVSVAYGASVLLFGGIGLLVAFLIEVKLNRKE